MHEEEFEEFVRTTAPRLHRAAVLLAGEHQLAEDLTQIAYAKVYASWPRVRRADDPVAYARTVLLNSFLSHRRLRRSGERPTDFHTDAHRLRPAPGTPDAGVRVDLERALATLPPLDRAIVVLRYWDDRSVEETASELSMSAVAVRTRAHRALKRLRPLLAESDVAPGSAGSAATLPVGQPERITR